MTAEDVFTIVEMIDSINRGRYARPMIEDGRYRNVGVLWAQELEDADAERATLAVAALFAESSSYENPRPVTIKDFKETIRKIEMDERMARPALPEAEFVREMPMWARAWMVARSRGDTRLWPEQKDGYDLMQIDHPQTRTYIWGEQTQGVMPDGDRAKYEDVAGRMTPDDLERMRKAVVGA